MTPLFPPRSKEFVAAKVAPPVQVTSLIAHQERVGALLAIDTVHAPAAALINPIGAVALPDNVSVPIVSVAPTATSTDLPDAGLEKV